MRAMQRVAVLGWIVGAAAALAPTLPTAPSTGASATPNASPLLEAVLESVNTALETCDIDAKDRDGSWCFDANQQRVAGAMEGLRGRKMAWWLDSPRPLRSIVDRGRRHEISVVALP